MLRNRSGRADAEKRGLQQAETDPYGQEIIAETVVVAAPSLIGESRGQPSSQPIKIFKSAQRSQSGESRRRRMPSIDNAADRRLVHRLDTANDLEGIERRPMNQE